MTTHHHPSTAKHVFLHLLLIGMLFMNLIAMIQLAFLYIDRLFPDGTAEYVLNNYSTIRWTSSVLVVCIPVFLIVSRYIYKDITRDESLQHIWVRRWLLSFTLFSAAITIIGSLISIVYNFYNGELTVAFTCKLAVLILLAFAIGAYYRWDMKREMKKGRAVVHVAWITTAVVTLAMLIIGVSIIGTPAHQRKVQNDETRLNDLQNIQSYIYQYYNEHSTVPTSLEDLKNDFITVPTDPKTDAGYEYVATSTTAFQLCANFETEGKEGASRAPKYDYAHSGYLTYTDEWKHDASRTCFQREININKVNVPTVQ
ncbi:MAG: DUF5671 domain-containing protein [Candidatus Kerfeldbacteria bacterium]|nr:DUF5671 domain-containing protein [Candidatus Kerfeldbacteria bacterium]